MKSRILRRRVLSLVFTLMFLGCLEHPSRSTQRKVATPTISPKVGDFATSQQVTLTCATADADIYYTLDGNGPTTSSLLYSVSFTVSETTTVKAIGIKAGFDPSAIATAIFTKEKETLTPLDEKYLYFPIKLKEFVVTDKDSSSEGATEEDNRRAREISIEEKTHILEAISLMRFVINTPEFKTEFDDVAYKFEAAEGGSGIRTIKKGEYYDKEIVFNMLKNAAITTYILKDDIGFDANALGTLGPHFYVNVDAENPVIEGDNDNAPWVPLDLVIILPNTIYWIDTNTIYGDKYRLAQIIFHEVIHNLGFNHLNGSPNEPWDQYDTADFMENIFREVIGKAEWRNKYKTEFEQYNHYQTKYANFLESKTIPK